MKLRDLFNGDAGITMPPVQADVVGLAVDSRAVKSGDVFFALSGTKSDGARFIDQAIEKGAMAVVSDRLPQADSQIDSRAIFIASANPKRSLALAAAAFYPRQPQVIAAVTGTSGKTSVAAFTRQIWQRLGHQAASIGTIGPRHPRTHGLWFAHHAGSDRVAPLARRDRGRGRYTFGT